MNRPRVVSAFFSVAAFVMATPFQAAPSSTGPASDWNIAAHIPLERVVIPARRGAGFLAEENTIEAFELGRSLGCYAEADLRTTTDGVIVAFHDANFDRVVAKKKK